MVKTTVELIPQPHGGALASGGTPGNKGGGRPPSALREAFRGGGQARDRDIVNIFRTHEQTIHELPMDSTPVERTTLRVVRE